MVRLLFDIDSSANRYDCRLLRNNRMPDLCQERNPFALSNIEHSVYLDTRSIWNVLENGIAIRNGTTKFNFYEHRTTFLSNKFTASQGRDNVC